jgi:hypothetical protein
MKKCKLAKAGFEEFAISVFHAISEIGPERYAISVPGAKQKLGLKKYAIRVYYAISVKAPENHAISVIWAKQGKRSNVAESHWPPFRPTYFANSVYVAISVGVKTQPFKIKVYLSFRYLLFH